MFKTIITAVATLAVSGISNAQWEKDIQWPTSNGGNGHWYRLASNDNGINWNGAKAAAESVGGHLVTSNSSQEDDFVRDNLVECTSDGVPNKAAWMGGQKLDGSWTWITGEVWSYENWAANDPNSSDPDAVLNFHPTESDNCGWADVSPGDLWNYYVIEFSADCNGDGIVDFGQILDGSLTDVNGNGVPDCCDDTTCLAPVQWKIEDGGNGHWYLHIEEDLTWDAAQAACLANGGHLATSTSSAEQQAIESFFPGEKVWLGGEADDSDVWHWVTGEPFGAYTNWLGGHPIDGDNSRFLEMLESGKWAESEAGLETDVGYVMEWSADCNDDGIVDYGQILDGSLSDGNGNGVPDVCESFDDCNNNGIDDPIDIAKGTSQDCNQNGIPDECDVADGTSNDCNSNNIPDDCETLADCDGDGTPDVCEILNGAIDANPADGVPDECQGLPVGACCVTGQCSGLTAAQCFELDGNFAGIGISCADANCPTTCAGDVNGDNQIGIIDLLTIIDGWGFCP